MSTLTRTPTTHPAPAEAPTALTAVRRVRSLATAEVRLLMRNRTSLLYALAFPVAGALLVQGAPEELGLDLGTLLVIAITVTALLIAVYYNGVTTLVARREGLVLKRLRTGELSDGEILAGMVVPAALVTLAQVAVAATGAAVGPGLAVPVNPVLIAVSLLGGIVVCALLAAITTIVTRTVESAQLTTMPLLALPFALSGVLLPRTELPEWLQPIAQAVPFTPVVDLLRLGLAGRTPDGDELGFVATFAEAGPMVAVLAAWIVVGVWVVRTRFRWDPRP